MSRQTVKLMGEPNLIEVSTPVVDFGDSLQLLIADLKETMKAEGGVGIAAPQIGCNQRVICLGFEKNERYPDKAAVPFQVLVNPKYEVLSQKQIVDWEGCLSVPGLRGLVARYERIHYRGYNEKGEYVEGIASDFHARIIQHEVDHLNGILFPFRMDNLKHLLFQSVYTRLHTSPLPKAVDS
ncbi:MAG: def 1 [Gammaproteobacteria bacterium]|jgi:peptide deformylase|nr:def 1 [Gammaproteobacteria bacterium]